MKKIFDFKNILKNQKGISLVEITIAAGLMSVVAVFMMRMQSNQVRTQNDIAARDEIRLFMRNLETLMHDRGGYCLNTFSDITDISKDKEFELEAIKDGRGAVAFKVGEHYGNRHFILKSIEKEKFKFDGREPYKGILTLKIGLEKAKDVLGGKYISQNLDLIVTLNDYGQVLYCGDQPDSLFVSGSGYNDYVEEKELDENGNPKEDTHRPYAKVKKSGAQIPPSEIMAIIRDPRSADPAKRRAVEEMISKSPELKMIYKQVKEIQEMQGHTETLNP